MTNEELLMRALFYMSDNKIVQEWFRMEEV